MKAQIKFGNKKIGDPEKCFVIAEAGSNHNCDLEIGRRLIEAAKKCGCDAIKFQAFKTENLVTRKAGKAEYQKGKSPGKSQFEMLNDLELSMDEHYALVAFAKVIDIPIFYSVFDEDSADVVDEIGVEIFKLGSGELTNIPLIKHIAKKGKPLILSTGMAFDEEITDAITAFKEEANKQLLLMHCSTGYPSRIENANLRRIKYLEERFGVLCGNSDHTEGITVSVIAAALGTTFIEKHFTLDKNFSGPDHSMSMDPNQMKRLSNTIRVVERSPVTEDSLREALKRVDINITHEEIRIIMGRADRMLSEIELGQRLWSRKSLVAAKDIGENEVITDRNLAIKRPEQGILPKEYKKVIGKKARYAITEGTPINWEMLE